MTTVTTKLAGILAVFASLAAVQPLRAQSSPDSALQVGARVRVQAPVLGAKPRIGNFVSLRSDTLAFTLDGQTVPTRVPVSQVTELDVSAGNAKNRPAVQKRSLIAEIIGATAGALVGVQAGSGSNRMKLILGAAGGLGGYFAGRAYGTITVPATVEKWQPVTIRANGT